MTTQQLTIDADLTVFVHHHRGLELLDKTIIEQASQERRLAAAKEAGNQVHGNTLCIGEDQAFFRLIHTVNSIPGFTVRGKGKGGRGELPPLPGPDSERRGTCLDQTTTWSATDRTPVHAA